MPNVYSVNLVSTSSQAFSATDHADFKPTGNFTFGGYIKTSSTAFQMLFFSCATDLLHGIFLDLNAGTGAGKTIRGTISGNGTVETNASSFCNGAWHWIVWTYDGTTSHLYLDANELGTGQTISPTTYTTNNVRIGCYYDGTNKSFFDGNIDEFFLINGTAWSPSQIAASYHQFISDPNLKAYYQFENNNNDSTAGTHTLSNIGTPTFQTDVPFVGVLATFRHRTLLGVGQ